MTASVLETVQLFNNYKTDRQNGVLRRIDDQNP